MIINNKRNTFKQRISDILACLVAGIMILFGLFVSCLPFILMVLAAIFLFKHI